MSKHFTAEARRRGVRTYVVTVKGHEERFSRTVCAASRGKAKREYHSILMECSYDVPWTALRARVGRGADWSATKENFQRCAEYRDVPTLQIGQRVRYKDNFGYVVGCNASANFDVQFDDNSPLFQGRIGSLHVNEMEIANESEQAA